MARGKIQIKRIENSTNRQVTYSKRRNGLFKKANELTVLCDARVSIIMFSTTDKLHEFTSPSTSTKQVIDLYQKTLGIDIWNTHYEKMQEQLKQLKEVNRNLRKEIRKRMGDCLNDLSIEDLRGLEQEMDKSVTLIRDRKYKVLGNQIDTSRKKMKNVEEIHKNLLHYLTAMAEKEKNRFTFSESVPARQPPLVAERRMGVDSEKWLSEQIEETFMTSVEKGVGDQNLDSGGDKAFISEASRDPGCRLDSGEEDLIADRQHDDGRLEKTEGLSTNLVEEKVFEDLMGDSSESEEDGIGELKEGKRKKRNKYYIDINKYLLGSKLITPKSFGKPKNLKKNMNREGIRKAPAYDGKENKSVIEGTSTSNISVTDSTVERFNSAFLRRQEAIRTWEVGKKVGFLAQSEEEVLKEIERIQGASL